MTCAAVIAPMAAAHAEAGSLAVSVASVPVSEQSFTLEVSAQDPAAPVREGGLVVATWTGADGSPRSSSAVAVAGTAQVGLMLWRTTSVTVSADGFAAVEVVVGVRPVRKPVADPATAPRIAPRYRFDDDPAGEGVGAHAVIDRIGPSRAATMRGRSWHLGCTPLAALREVHVNYWGRDGFRHRGTLIVSASIASDTAAAFAALYGIGYRLQSMHPVDRYGPSRRGPGADDYGSMSASNTSAFNCRYVVGKESRRVLSPHASGRSIDINPWNNPYQARTGTFPDRWWVQPRGKGGMQFRTNRAALAILRHFGFHWGGAYGDYHHFQH